MTLVVLSALVTALPVILLVRPAGWRQWLVLAVALAWALLPGAVSSVALLAALGIESLSLVSGMLVLRILLQRQGFLPPLPVSEAQWIALLSVLAGTAWYGGAGFGIGALHGLGWGDFPFSTGLLLIGMLAWVVRAYTLCLLLALAQMGFLADLLPVANLWYYLVDPLLVLAALGYLLQQTLAGRLALLPANHPRADHSSM